MTHPYLPNSPPQIKQEMLRQMGVKSIEELYSDVPSEARFKGQLKLPEAKSEAEIEQYFKELFNKNKSTRSMTSFLGGGCYDHHVPAIVREVMGRAEFFTSYTQYQPEASQGMLQALFEFQSLICELAAMDVSNSSLYDCPTALGEAALMAARITKRRRILIPRLIHPARRAVLRNYTTPLNIEVEEIGYTPDTGQLSQDELEEKLTSEVAAVYVENPSFLGFLEEGIDEIASATHRAGALLISGVDLISLGILRPPGDYESDIVVSEGQPAGIPMSYGGPSLGILASRGESRFIHQVPGRIIGQTTTIDGKQRGYTMVLQSREQHIRREKATSNICTNEALLAVGVAVYLSALGAGGLRNLAESIMEKAQYAIELLSSIPKLHVPRFRGTHFQEFVVDFTDTGLDVKSVNSRLLERNVHGGGELKLDFPELKESALYCISELHTKEQLNEAAGFLKEILGGS